MLVPLGAVRAGGGQVPRTVVVVQRKYPPLFRDVMPDGQTLKRTPRAKAAADRFSEESRQDVRPSSELIVHHCC